MLKKFLFTNSLQANCHTEFISASPNFIKRYRNKFGMTMVVILLLISAIGTAQGQTYDITISGSGKIIITDFITDFIVAFNTQQGTSYTSGDFPYTTTELNIIIEGDVTEIDDMMFSKFNRLLSVTLPSSLIIIGMSAFENCSALESITIPANVTTIVNSAFYGCTGLTSVTFDSPSKLDSIENKVFYGCTGLTSITIPENVITIDNKAFYGCSKLTTITFSSPSKLEHIKGEAFYGCTGLKSITFPNSLKIIDIGTFYDCTGLTSVTLPEGLTEIRDNAFNACTGLTSITIPSSVTQIGDAIFHACTGLKSVTLSNSLTSIGNDAFKGCISLESIIIPDGVTSIGDAAFWDCSSLGTITILVEDPTTLTLGTGVFYGINAGCVLIVPDGSKSAYNTSWSSVISNFGAVYEKSELGTEAYIVPGSLPTDGQLINKDGSGGGYETMKNGYSVSFANVSDASKQYKIIYEIKNTKGRTIYKKEEVVCKNDLSGETVFTKEYNLRPSGNGQGTIILTIKDMKGKVIATATRTFEVEGIPPRIISVKKKK